MFALKFTNVVCSSDGRKFADLESAINHGRECGFEFSIWNDDRLVASWTVFGGLRRF